MANQKKEAPELYPDAWDRFRQAVHVMAKAGPQHRIRGAAVKSGPQHKAKLQAAGNEKATGKKDARKI